MPQLAFDIGFFAELPKLQPPVRKGVLDAWEKFGRLTLDQLFKDPGLKLESLTKAKDKQIRTIRIDQFWRGVVLAPPTGDTFVLLRVLPHDKAIDWAMKQKSSINEVTRAVEIRDAATLDEITRRRTSRTAGASTRTPPPARTPVSGGCCVRPFRPARTTCSSRATRTSASTTRRCRSSPSASK